MHRTRLLVGFVILVVLGGVAYGIWRSRSNPTDDETESSQVAVVLDEACTYGGEFKSIEAVDAMTVKFTLCYPDAAFPAKVASTAMGIHPSEYLEATGGGGELIRHPIGTGPYKFDHWTAGTEIGFTANATYWGGIPKEPNLIFRWNAESRPRLLELLDEAVDGIDNINTDEAAVVDESENLTVYRRIGTNVLYLGMNNTYEPFEKLEVRQAIDYVIDRQHFAANYYLPGSVAATQFIPPGVFGFTTEVLPPNYGLTREQRILQAKLLMQAAGMSDGFETTLTYRDVVRTYITDPFLIARDIQSQLADIGIKVELEVMESGAFLDDVDSDAIGMYLLGWNGDYPDATDFLDFHFGAGSSLQFGDKIPELTNVLADASHLYDSAERYQLYLQANQIIRDQVPMVPIVHAGSAAAFKTSITGAYAAGLGVEQFWLMEDPDDDNIIWMQTAEPLGLYCADETDAESLRACGQVNEALLTYDVGTGQPLPALAIDYSANDDLTEWTFKLREDVKFHDGSAFDAADVVASFTAQWDAASPLHVGREGLFSYFKVYFMEFLNVVQATEEEEE
jgi:peptide/nickel transport system substrate-binding protein